MLEVFRAKLTLEISVIAVNRFEMSLEIVLVRKFSLTLWASKWPKLFVHC